MAQEGRQGTRHIQHSGALVAVGARGRLQRAGAAAITHSHVIPVPDERGTGIAAVRAAAVAKGAASGGPATHGSRDALVLVNGVRHDVDDGAVVNLTNTAQERGDLRKGCVRGLERG